MIKDMFLGCCIDSLGAGGKLTACFNRSGDCPICSGEGAAP